VEHASVLYQSALAKLEVKKVQHAISISDDAAASIVLYTSGTNDVSLFSILNKLLRDTDRDKLKPFFSYLQILIKALHSLPDYAGKVYRGVDVDLSDQYQQDKVVHWWGFSSCSKDRSQADAFTSSKSSTIFTINCKYGKEIEVFSAYAKEQEVVLLPGSIFKVISVTTVDKFTFIALDQLPPKYDVFPGIS